MQTPLYRWTQTCSRVFTVQWRLERTPFHGPRLEDRLGRDDPNGSSYHGHRIDVLLTEQRLEKQHCTLGKRESGGDGSTEKSKERECVCVYWVKRGHGCRKAWNKGSDDEGIRGRFTQ